MIDSRRILLYSSFPLLLLIGALGGAYLTRHAIDSENSDESLNEGARSGEAFGKVSDVIRGGYSSRVRVRSANAAMSSNAEAYTPEATKAQEALLKIVPYAVLKRIYFERQDEERERMDAHFDALDESDADARKKHADSLFRLYTENGDGRSYFMASGDWSLRGGRQVPYVVLVSLYSSKEPGSVETPPGVFQIPTEGDATLATRGEELCFGMTFYLKTGESYAWQGGSNCLGWAESRSGRPYMHQSVYQEKALMPYFDAISLPVPGFAPDSEGEPEWYEANLKKWNSLGKIRWETLQKDEFKRRTKELEDQAPKR